MLPAVVLISGEGSNLQAILDANLREPVLDLRAVISSRVNAHGLARARAAGIPVHALPATPDMTRTQYDAELAALIVPLQPALLILAGFMRILSAEFVAQFHGRLLNIHPSLLPKYPGLDTHRRALNAGETEHGCSVHFVTAAVDGGPVIAQARVPVLPGDSPQKLGARVQTREHRLYPQIVNAFARGRVKLENDRVWWNGQPLLKPRVLAWNEDLIT
ncbi:MAG TPA: phosphoribosylglycinamide formyltransferase [Gammaproteobacteria bacterium]|nr:phosphoribosylglycinamide formyltransferase [Gammaproteobacteria bacterium]